MIRWLSVKLVINGFILIALDIEEAVSPVIFVGYENNKEHLLIFLRAIRMNNLTGKKRKLFG